jgi:CNT family concentrative nucleoside transporter
MERFQGIIGVILILGIAFLFSNNKKRINYRLVITGILLQLGIALLIFKVGPVQWFFQQLGKGIGKLEQFSKAGVDFVYCGVANI